MFQQLTAEGNNSVIYYYTCSLLICGIKVYKLT
jgi:hypothetical protein